MERCLSFVQCQLHPANAVLPSPKRWHAVTISRQTGSGGHAIADALAKYLQSETADPVPWTVFDRNLVEKVLEDHHLPGYLARFMPEDRHSQIEDTLDDLLGVHPPSAMLVEKIVKTIRHLADLGNVILLGRGANVVTNAMESVFHVRLVGALERRVERIQKLREISRKAALDFIQREDRGRERYLKTYFHKDIDDPLLYHLTINSDLLAPEKVAQIIGDAMLGPVAAHAKKH